MLCPQKVRCKAAGGNGISAIGFDELRKKLANETSLSDAHRQRLLDIGKRLARVQAYGTEYAGISLSPMAAAVVEQSAVTV